MIEQKMEERKGRTDGGGEAVEQQAQSLGAQLNGRHWLLIGSVLSNYHHTI